MPYKRKDSPIWWVSLIDSRGQRVRRPTGTTDRKEAEALEAKWKLEAYRRQNWDEAPGRTFEELMLAYLNATASEKRSAPKDRERTRTLRRFFAGRDMRALVPTDVRGFIDLRKKQGVSNSTVNRELCLLSVAINFANREWDWRLPNPVIGRKLKEPEGRVRWLTRAEAVALLAAADASIRAPHLADFLRLALNTGMRRGELLRLEWRRVDLREGLVFLEAEHTKTKRRRSVPLNAEARAALIRRARFRAEHCADSPWVFCGKDGKPIAEVKRSFAAACAKAGIADFRIHDLRHTCAAWLVSAGVPLSEVRDLLGHASVVMTERYAHLAPENVRAAVQRLEGQSRSGHATHKDAGAGSS